VHLIGFTVRKYVTMHGNVNVKYVTMHGHVNVKFIIPFTSFLSVMICSCVCLAYVVLFVGYFMYFLVFLCCVRNWSCG
jgi:hypothetical protein